MENVSDEQHGWLRTAYQRPPGDASFDVRLEAFDRLLVSRWPLLVLRLLWSQANGTDRLRFSQVQEDRTMLWARFIRFIERAESLLVLT